jgi:23S rRNA pseudouridine2605 synthase
MLIIEPKMRLNKFIALHTGLSRRRVDQLIKAGKVLVNGEPAVLGIDVDSKDKVFVNGLEINAETQITTIMLNKTAGYVVSRAGQGSKTIYELLPKKFHNLKPIGRLDKDSSGLLLLTNDGELANKLTHPSHQKKKIYEIELDHSLTKEDFDRITKASIQLKDGPSKFKIVCLNDKGTKLQVTMSEGRNRQIRRTFAALGYKVIKLHRTQFGKYRLDSLTSGQFLGFN